MTGDITGRDTLLTRLPRWLRNTYAARIAYAIGVHFDAIIDASSEGLQSSFPGWTGVDSYGDIGRQRRIRRGLNETTEVYAGRLRGWLDAHPRRGGPYALLEQIYAFYAPNNFRVELINPSGLRYNLNPSTGEITRDFVTWTPPGDHPDMWARWWLFFFVPDPPGDDGLWGDPGDWGDGGIWGIDLTPEEIDLYQTVASEWRAEHVEGRIIVLDEADEWDTYAPGEWPAQIVVR